MPMITKNKKQNIAVLFGGISPEHEISVITGVQVINNIDTEKYNVLPIFISKKGEWYYSDYFSNINVFKNVNKIPFYAKEVFFKSNTAQILFIKKASIFSREKAIKIDAIIPCFHGDLGEGGGYQGLFELLDIPYTGSTITGSVIGINKILTKQILNINGIETVSWISINKREWEKNKKTTNEKITSKIKLPLIVKPATCGSSIGITKIHNIKDLENALEVAFNFDDTVIIEKFLNGYKEVNISVMETSNKDIKTSEIEEVFHTTEFLNYEDKYISKKGNTKGMVSASKEIPAKINNKIQKSIQGNAIKYFNILQLSGLVRFDFLINEEKNKIYLIEVNTIPGSLSFYLWEPVNIKFKDVINNLIDNAVEKYNNNKLKTKSFPNNIFNNLDTSLKAPKIR